MQPDFSTTKTVWRSAQSHANRADPTCGFVDDLSCGVFQALSAGHIANDSDAFAVGRPVSPLNVVFNRTRGAAREHHAGERARALVGGEEPRRDTQCELAAWRNAKQISVGN